MYKYLKCIQDQFKNYHIYDGEILLVRLDELGNTLIRVCRADTLALELEIRLGFKTFTTFLISDENIIAYFPLQRIERIDLQSGTNHEIEVDKFAPEALIHHALLGNIVDESFPQKAFARMDLQTGMLNVLINEPFRIWGKSDQDIYGVKAGKGRTIYSINQESGAINWSRDFDSDLHGKIFSFGRLCIVVGKSILYGLEAATGKTQWERHSTNYLLQLYGDKIINVDAGFYREISPATGETLCEYDMKQEYEQHGFKNMGTNKNFTVTPSHIFIVDAMGYRLGCINRSTGKIDWSVAVGEGKVTLPHAPIVHEEKLYVLDDEGTLHVYAKE